MKKIIIIIVFILFSANNIMSQCSNQESVPEEMYKGRYQESDMSYGNPYTTFDRHNNLSLYQKLNPCLFKQITKTK